MSSPARAGDLGNARLLIAGTDLEISPESQTVPFNTPTVVETRLAGYDATQGVLPEDLRVLADFTGPEIEGILVLETRPGQPFRIPRLSLKGEYVLDDVRLVQGDELLAYAHPRSAAVLVTQVLVTRVTSRALTLDEIRRYGIVIDDDNYRAFNFTFGFAVDGEVYDYNVPVMQSVHRGEEYRLLVEGAPSFGRGGEGTSSPRFRPPQVAPFVLELEKPPTGGSISGGCDDPFGCVQGTEVSLPGVLLFPTDVSLLNQYFSVVLAAKNDAPAGDPLVIRDLTAKVTLPPGLRMAETEPPTPLGVPVPVRVPGPDGELGTGDDLTFLVAQASGEAEVLVEGRKEGTHVVSFDLEGVLEGLPMGGIQRVTGRARGAVVVRDPTLGITISHPSVVRELEDYTLRLTVSNTAAAPVNLVTVALPPSALSGVEVVGEAEKTIPALLPGESELVDFLLRPTRTGKVVASSVRSPYQVEPRFELTVAVGDSGIPLSPDAIVLPDSTEALPAELVDASLALVGLGFSLATAPAAGLDTSLPRMNLSEVDEKVYWLTQGGRHAQLGEELFDAVAVLAAEWTGARGSQPDWEWDRLRRTTQKGGWFGDAVSGVLAAEAAATSPRASFERFAATTSFVGPIHGALAVGSGARLEVTSRTSGLRTGGGGLDPARLRDLPFADLYDLDGLAQMALLARPEEGGHQLRLTDGDGGSSDLRLFLPDGTGGVRTVSWTGVTLGSGGLAVVDYGAEDPVLTLYVDADGDGLVDQQSAGVESSVARRPFAAVAAVQKASVVSGHAVEVLFTRDLDLAAMVPVDPGRFTLPGNVSNGGLVPTEASIATITEGLIAENRFAGLRDTRVVLVMFSNPVTPYAEHSLTVRHMVSADGAAVVETTLPVTTTVDSAGGILEGTLYGSDGQPVPFAKVELFESDLRWQNDRCIRHRTAAVNTDAAGRFRFDYVRSNNCGGGVFRLRAVDPQSGRTGEVSGRVRFEGQVHELDLVMLGRGTIRGRVTYDDGTVPSALDVLAHSPVFAEALKGSVGPDGTYELRKVPVGTVTVGATDRAGSFVYQTLEVPVAGAVVERDLVILRRSGPTAATGDVRGTVHAPDGTTPVFNAYLALYVDGELVGVERSAPDGTFDFGTVPVGLAEIQGFDGETGLSGVRVHFEVQADQVNAVALRLLNERGVVEGHVYRRTAQGTVPLAGAVVYAPGTPFNTVTDANGFYRLDGVFAGNGSVEAADLDARETVRELVTVTDGATTYRDLYFVEDFGQGGIVGEVLGFSGNPVPGAVIHLGGTNDQLWWGEFTTDTQGRFTIPDLQPGTYTLHAMAGSAGARREVEVLFQGQTPFVSLRFKKGTVRGRTVTTTDSGDPIGVRSLVTYRTTVVNEGLVTLSWKSTTIETDDDGGFEIPDVLAGKYVLSVGNAFYDDQTLHGEMVFHGEVIEHEISFQRNGSIRGTVLDVDGETPVAGAVVHLRHPNFGEYDVVSGEDGRFAFELVPPAGQISLDVEYDDGVLYRQGRVWVSYGRHGQDVDVSLVLPVQGTVSGWVEDAGGLKVPGAVVTLREHSYPRRSLVQTADGEGQFSFTNVFVGRVSIEAQAPSLGGVGGRSTSLVTTEGEEVWTLVSLEGSGEIAGRVLAPVDGEPVPSAHVTLYRWTGGVIDAATSDAEGNFRFRLLPIGLYRAWAFDPRTGRHGALDPIPIDYAGHVSGAEVVLEVRGEVEGHLYDPATGATVPGATIELRTDSLVNLTTFSSADGDGFYEFLGIPEGTFVLSTREPEGRRTARSEGGITEEGERVTVDLHLEATGRVVGTVLNPPGAPDGPFPSVNTVIREQGPVTRVVGATLDNPFTFEGLIVGRQLILDSYEVGGNHRGQSRAVITQQGEELTVDVTVQPIGSVVVVVTDSFGSAVPGAELELTSSGFYGGRRLFGSTGPDGRATFHSVGVGHVGGFVTNPVSGLKGSGSGEITLDGQQLEIAFQLEDAARLRGRVLLADGVTPAEDGLVVVTVSGRTYQLRADANGEFEFASLPLGDFSLYGQEYFGDSYRERTGTLATNGELVDVGDLVLDDADPELVAHQPLSGARDVPLSSAVVLQFSEPLDRSSFSSSWFSMRTLAGSHVGYSVAWSDGDATATLTPSSPLANFTGYQVIVGDARDLAGRRLKERVKMVFYTVDQVPPAVVDVLPRDGQVQVPVDESLRVTFSEPVVLESLSGSALHLADADGGQGVTTTFQLLPGERQVLVTPQQLLLTDRTYRLTVQGVRDGSGNTMSAPVSTTFKTPDTIPPTIDSVGFLGGTAFTSGDDVPVTVTATDPSGVGQVTVHVGDWSFTDTAAPWEVTALAPVVAVTTDQALVVEVGDVYGNTVATERTVQVSPRINGSPPSVTTGCAKDGDHVLPGFEIELVFEASDDEAVESYRLLVDGVEREAYGPINQLQASHTFHWHPPEAPAGTAFLVRVEARDFAGNVAAEDLGFTIPGGTVLTAPQSLFAADVAGAPLTVAGGSFPVRDPLVVPALTVLRGAVLTGTAAGAPVSLEVSGEVQVQCGASIDQGGNGYAGGSAGHPAGYGPEGPAPAGPDAGGSHGGAGTVAGGAGPIGDVYGSIQKPRSAGAGGAFDGDRGGAGGGALHLVAETLKLEGDLRSHGAWGCSGGAGAGGSVLVEAGTLRGAGTVGAHGSGSCSESGAGGGGRVAIHADLLDGFDPWSQASSLGGERQHDVFAAPGTVLVRTPADSYGVLQVSNGSKDDAARLAAFVELPQLGLGMVTGLVATGDDAWVTAGVPLRDVWVGAWMVLEDASGSELGTYEVIDLDAEGRVRLSAAAAVAGAMTFRGEYRFDRIELGPGGGVAASDPVRVTELRFSGGRGFDGDLLAQTVTFGPGSTILQGSLSAGRMTVEAGAVVSPAGKELDLTVTGTLTVQSGAILSARGHGYPAGQAPPGIVASSGHRSGGSHGGVGLGESPGEVFDSVYRPGGSGGGGSNGQYNGAPGGGVITLTADELVLDGELHADGSSWCGGGAGGGGAIFLDVGTLRGEGLARADGGDYYSCYYTSNAGGGGRIALRAQVVEGFDPATRLSARGGWDGSDRYAAPGTVLYRIGTQVHGTLIVDNGRLEDGTHRVSSETTRLPALPLGILTAAVVDGPDLWISADPAFQTRSVGTWVRLDDIAGGELGAFEVTELDPQGRIRLAGAGAVTGAVTFRSEYRFDRVEIRNGSKLASANPLIVDELTATDGGGLEGDATIQTLVFGAGTTVLDGRLEARNVTLETGAILGTATQLLDVAVEERLEIRAGALVHADSVGYTAGQVPPGVIPASGAGGGASHGGMGYAGSPGEVYDSVFWPQLAGGGGMDGQYSGAPGGGVVLLSAAETVLDGEIQALGSTWCGGGAGAGGSIRLTTGVLRGTGLVRALGGNITFCSYAGHPAGGGRIAVHADLLDGFDPATQLQAFGGGNESVEGVGAPGTVLYRIGDQASGVLRIDNGVWSDGTPRSTTNTATPLPPLGEGSLGGFAPSGVDAWVEIPGGFLHRWLGSWMVLEGPAGIELGAFEVVERDDLGRLRLAGAGAVGGATSFRGEYRFDRIELRNGARLRSSEPLVTGSVDISGGGEIDAVVETTTGIMTAGTVAFGRLQAQDLTLAQNGFLHLAPGRQETEIVVAGTLTIEAGSGIAANGRGYDLAPTGVTPASGYKGAGSHGGRGTGEVFGRVYHPDRPGGRGADGYNGWDGGPGGGLLRIQAQKLLLDGTIQSRGVSYCGLGGGAGGSVVLDVHEIGGTGSVDADGPDRYLCHSNSTAGAGGRVALFAEVLNGFDPMTQLHARGGSRGSSLQQGPGTVFFKLPHHQHGVLLVDQGIDSGSTPPATPLPAVGRGTVGTVTVDGDDAWIKAADTAHRFGVGVVGTWVRIGGIDYPVLGRSEDRRQLRLEGAAGTVDAGEAFAGLYKLDEVHVRGLAHLTMADGLNATTVAVAPGSQLTHPDVDAPEITVTAPAAGSLYSSGDSVLFTADVTDANPITRVVFRLGAQTHTDEAAPWEATLPAPVVEVEGDVDATVEATDAEGNVGTMPHTLRIQPLPPGDPPQVAVTCPSPGARLVAGSSLNLTLDATHDTGIETVELTVGTDPTVVTTLTTAPYTFRLDVPAGAGDGDVVDYRFRARSFSGNTAEVAYPVQVVSGIVVATDTYLAPDDLSLENASVIVTGGTFTVEGTHTFRDLVVLDGATVTHPPATSAEQHGLDLFATRDVFVSCGGVVDAAGRGWPGSSQGGGDGPGGDHGGRGGVFDGSGWIYGSPFNPRDAGAGGGLDGAGGGVVRLVAGGDIVLDGTVSAAAATPAGTAPLGAGGSILLQAAAMRGLGTVDASGGGDGTARAAGGGGRVALYAATIDDGLLGRTTAAGGAASTTALTGGAGTLYVKRDVQPLGDLVLDNRGRSTDHLTELLAAPPSTVEVVNVDGFTDFTASFPHSLAGSEVALNGDLSTLWMVQDHADGGDTLVLDVAATPWAAVPGDGYEIVYRFDRVVVRGGTRALTQATVLSETAPEVEAGSSWEAAYRPSVELTAPPAGSTLTSGTPAVFTAVANDGFGLDGVTFGFDGTTHTDPDPPYEWSLTVPPVDAPELRIATVDAVDRAGNLLHHEISLTIEPNPDPHDPTVTLGDLPASGDVVLPGEPLNLAFTVNDLEQLYSWRVEVNGVQVDERIAIGATTASGTVTWAPPVSDPPGSSYLVRVEAWDYGGRVGWMERPVRVGGTLLTGSQSLQTDHGGADLVLSSGTFTATGPLRPAALALVNGAILTTPQGQPLELTVTGELRVQSGTWIDVTGRGYSGATTTTAAGVPTGVASATDESGGHHGGIGMRWYTATPTGGETYGSVYHPSFAGGGGALDDDGSGDGGAGGGVVLITAGAVVMDGRIDARGPDGDTLGRAGGAGGTVSITAGQLSGSGPIYANGGFARSCSGSTDVGAGGGGRIAIHVGQLLGFDPATQAWAQPGTFFSCSWSLLRAAGAGTVFVSTAASTYGDLRLDAGYSGGTNIRGPSPATPLPVLGSGVVQAQEVASTDLWITGASAFRERWLGVWMVLEDVLGGELGTFEVAEIDASGRLRLSGAGTVSGAVAYQGEYRFDSITLERGAGLEAQDPVVVDQVVAVDGSSVAAPIEATSVEIRPGTMATKTGLSSLRAVDLVVRSGAVVSAAAADGVLRLEVPGTLTVETGARIDTSAQGYGGGVSGSPGGEAPFGVAGSTSDAGGSHGGRGEIWSTGTPGETYDSVYRPFLGGGGGALDDDGAGAGWPGGGVIEVMAGSVVLDGELRSDGYSTESLDGAAGAGGTVFVEADSLTGSGRIVTVGGYVRPCVSYRYVGPGGGGRIALHVDSLPAFDLATQTIHFGGARYDCYWNASRYATAGTTYVRTSGSTHGDLYVDNWLRNGSPRTPTGNTPVPALGTGIIGVADPDPEVAADVWVEPQDPAAELGLGVTGAWMRIGGNDFRILDQLDRRRVRLEGAGGLVSVGDTYEGVYKFDSVTVRNGAVLQFLDTAEIGTTDVDAPSQLVLP